MAFGEVRPMCKWTAKGRLSYNKQWVLLRRSEEGAATVEAGYDAIRRCANASWFEWLDGSTPLFWNWPPEYQREVRDGQPHYITGSFGPPYLRPQSKHKDPAKQELMWAKVVKSGGWSTSRLGKLRAGQVSSAWTRERRTFGWCTTGRVVGLTTYFTPLTSGCLLYERPCGPSYQVSSSVTLTCKTNF